MNFICVLRGAASICSRTYIIRMSVTITMRMSKIEIEVRLVYREAEVMENKLGQLASTRPSLEREITLTSNGLKDPPSSSKKL